MTADLGDRRAAGPERDRDAEPLDDSGWWDRHGWELPPPTATAGAGSARQPEPDDAVPGGSAWFGWSALLVCVAVVGGLVTLPVLGFAGGFGRVLAPALWALLGTGVGVSLSAREPTWDLDDRRRVEPLVAWVLAYAVAAVVGLRAFEGVAAWWVPATVLTALAPVVTARLRRRAD